MSVADQINRIKTNIADTYTAAQAKGATMPQTKNSDNLAACVQSITTGGGGGGTQFGLTAEQMLGTLDSEGNLTLPTLPSITFTGLKNAHGFTLFYKFYQRNFEDGASVSFPDLTNIADYAMNSCFSSCYLLTSVVLPVLTTVGTGGMQDCFTYCESLTNIDLPVLTTVGNGGLGFSFSDCSSLTNVNLPALTTVGDIGMHGCFTNCTSLANISFPSLTTVQTNSFGDAGAYCFGGCDALTEIHFRADMQATIEALSGYADKWGATNATIYFDL